MFIVCTWDIKLWCRFLQKQPCHFFLQKALVEFIMRMLSRKPLVKHKFIVVNLRLQKRPSHLLFRPELWSSDLRTKINNYRIVASRSTCYYSENEKFCFSKSQILTCRIFFFRNKTFLFVVQMSWNFQHLIILGFRGSSQNFSSFGQLLFFDTPCY